MENLLREAAAALNISGELKKHKIIKTGNINQTFKASFDSGDYIIQKVNTYVFKNPEQMMANISGVTAHLTEKYRAAGKDPARYVLCFQRTSDGNAYWYAPDGSFWRAYRFIGDTVTYDSVPEIGLLTSAGEAFGEFTGMLSDYDMSSLYDTIPDFHDTGKRFAAFAAALEADTAGRAASIKPEIEFLTSRGAFCSDLVKQRASGALATRVTHNDTKYNNVLIDTKTHRPAAIIDLDTVMPGLAAYDFGDAIRFAANTSLEDEPDTSKTSLSLDYYDAFTGGYVGALAHVFDRNEILSLPVGAVMLTLELALRFCTDYLMGDPYFKLNYPEHNLVRTRCQIALTADMEKKFDKMVNITEKYI